jgi:hypothetical protein
VTDDPHDLLEHDGEADGGNQHCERGLTGKPSDHAAADQEPQRRRADDRVDDGKSHGAEREIEQGRNDRDPADRQIGAPHRHRAEGKIDAIGDAMDQHIGDGEKRVEAAYLHRV